MSARFIAGSTIGSFIFVGLTTSLTAHAQYMNASMYGTGIAPAFGNCSYESTIGPGAQNDVDDISDNLKEINDLKSEIKDLQSDKSEAHRTAKEGRDQFHKHGYEEGSEVDTFVGKVMGYSDSYKSSDTSVGGAPTSCDSFAPTGASRPSSSSAAPSTQSTGRRDGSTVSSVAPPADPGSQKESISFVNAQGFAAICRDNRIQGDSLCGDWRVTRQLTSEWNKQDCSEGLNKWQKGLADERKVNESIEKKKERIKKLTAANKKLKKDATKEFRDYARENQGGGTEGTICWECLATNASGQNRGGTGVNATLETAMIAGGVANTIFGGLAMDHISNNNAKLGFATAQPYPSIAYGMPYFMGALYGAIGGGGVAGGGFGCGSSMSGGGYQMGPNGMNGPYGMAGSYGPYGGAFGYPGNLYASPMGGGMFLPGMGPGGMAGPWGLGGGGSPGMLGGGYMSPYGTAVGGGFASPYGAMAGGGGFASPYGAMVSGGFMSPYGGGGYGAMAGGGFASPFGGGGYGAMAGGGFASPYGAMAGGGFASPYGAMAGGGFASPYGAMAGGGFASPYGAMAGGGFASPYGAMAGGGFASPYGVPYGGGAYGNSPYGGFASPFGGGFASPYGPYGNSPLGGQGYQQYLYQAQLQAAQMAARQQANYQAGTQQIQQLGSQIVQLQNQISIIQSNLVTGGTAGSYYMGPYGASGGVSIGAPYLPGAAIVPPTNPSTVNQIR